MTDRRHYRKHVPALARRELDYARLDEFLFRAVDRRARRDVWTEIAPFIWHRMGQPARALDPRGAASANSSSAIPAEERWLVDVVD